MLRYKNKVIKVYKKYTSITIINRCIIKAWGKLIKWLAEKAIAGKRAKTINSQAALKELTEVLNEVLVGRLDAIYNEREKMFQQGNYEEVQFRDYEIFKNRYLKNYKIKYYLIENERIPGLIKRG